MISDTPRTIPDQLRLLRTTTPMTGRVLTAYLDTSPPRAEKSAYLLAFRDGCKAIRAALDVGELDRFERAVEQAERFLTSQLEAGRPGLALFASGTDDYFFAVPLPHRPANEVTWGERPLLGPLEEILDECERIAVVLFDKERARLFSVYLGEIEERRTLRDDVPGKQATGGWFALAQARYARHHEDHVVRHAKHVIRELMGMLGARPFDRLLIGGPDEAVALLRHQLPRPLRSRLAGSINLELFAPDTAVLRAALQVAETIERQEEQAAVEELLEAASTPHVALGLRATLEALNDRRVHRLFIAGSFVGEAGECPRCERVVAGLERCPTCGTLTQAIGDLRERILEMARRQGARIEIVSGQAASLLAVHDGLGAWTRH